MRSTPKIIFHILPLRDFLDFEDKMKSSDIIYKMKLFEPLASLGSTDWSSEATGEGRLNFTHENDCRSYLHMFWKGGIEAVHGGLLTDIRGDKVPIPCLQLQHMLYRGLDRFLNLQNDIGVPPPFAMFLSLIEVAGYQVTEDSYGFKPKGGTHGKRIRKPEVNVRMQVVESYRSNRYTIVKKLVDNIWNEVGWDGAPDFSDQIVSRNPK